METSFNKTWLCPSLSCCPKNLSCPKFFFFGGGGGEGALPATSLPQSQYTYGNHALEHNDANTSMPVCTCTIMTWFLLMVQSGCPSFHFVLKARGEKDAWYIYFTPHLPIALNLSFCLICGNTKEPNRSLALIGCYVSPYFAILVYCRWHSAFALFYWNLL